MRRALMLALLLALVVPAGAAALVRAAGDGTLYVHNADGRVGFLRGFSGVVLGRVTLGTLEVIDPVRDCHELALLVWDDDEWRQRPLRGSRDGVKCVFRTFDRTTPMRFRLLGEDEIRITGTGIWISAVGQGDVNVQGFEKRRLDGTFSVNGERPRGMPYPGQTVEVRTRTSLP